MLSNLGITLEAAVDVTISTSRNLLKSSMTTSIRSPVGNGPRKSADRFFHGADGIGVEIIGSGVMGVLIVA